MHISFVKPNEDVFNAWCVCLNPELRGAFMQSNKVDPITKNKIERDCIYTPAEKKKIKPNQSCMSMYAIDNHDAYVVCELLQGEYGRILQEVPVTAYSLCDAILLQLLHDRNKYKAINLLQQIAFYMAKFPDKMFDITKPFLGDHSYESYIKNMYHGTKYLYIEVCIAAIALMWNIPINVVYPKEGSIPFYHPDTEPEVVIVCNQMRQPETQYTGTKLDNSKWRTIKGLDWSNKIKLLTNVKNAHQLAEKRLREHLANKVLNEFNECMTSLYQMKDQLSLYCDQIKSMQANMKSLVKNVSAMEGKQTVLRLRLMELGVDVGSLQKSGPAIEGLHFTSEIPVSTFSTTAMATVSTPPDFDQAASSTVVADIHPVPPTSTTVSSTVSQSVAETSTAATVSQPVAQTSTAATVANPSTGQIIPLSAAQISQLITLGASAVGGPQQILNIGGQNVLVSGSGPGTIRGSSVHYGKILKGVHKHFCARCKWSFTQKESLTRHEQENCPQLDPASKKKYKCDICGSEKFSMKQYLKEHMHLEHLKVPCYCCKGCGKEFYKHCNLSHHKKSCLQSLVPGYTPPQVTPPAPPQVTPPAPSTDDQPALDVNPDIDEGAGEVQEDPQRNPPIGGKLEGDDNDNDDDEDFKFSDPANPLFLPDL